MKQPAATVLPPEFAEVTSTVLWPSIGAFRLGRLVGQLCAVRAGHGFFTLGKLMALLSIPVSLALYLWKITPWACRRYRLTSHRILIEKGYRAAEVASIGLDQFEAIQVRVLPGQAWLRCGELVFLQDHRQQFRLSGVPQPESFRQTCLKARTALLRVREVLQRQRAAAG